MGIEIAVRRDAKGIGYWIAECDELLPFVSGTGRTPHQAALRLLRHVVESYERTGALLPFGIFRVASNRRRVSSIAANSAVPIYSEAILDEVLRSVDEHRPLQIVVARMREGSLSDQTVKTYRYTERRWNALTAAFTGVHGNARAHRDPGPWYFEDEEE